MPVGLFLCIVASQADNDFRLRGQRFTIPERGDIPGYVLTMSGKKYSFLQPEGWNVRSDAREKTVHFQRDDLTAKMSVRIVRTGQLENGVQQHWEKLRDEIGKRFPEGSLIREFRCFSAAGEGRAFDFALLVNQNRRITSRLAVILIADGMVEFQLTAPSNQFEDCHFAFVSLVSSFRGDSPSTSQPQSLFAPWGAFSNPASATVPDRR